MKHEPKLLRHTPWYEISYFAASRILQLTWATPPSQEEYKAGTQAFLETVQQHKPKKLISDNSKRGNPLPQDLLWLTHKVIPVLCQENVEQLAMVVPHDPHHARSLECCLMTSGGCYDLQFFHSTADAFDWLFHSSSRSGGRAVA
ncbi:hypothetical protein [Rufibacter sp. XAAS-G3-1]|uniref:hypothetical protein n=1 Tax=Rufibacter sp. XAAS-G3-1 TaxID=2729134 RepID=UPI0015E7D006|nr:hypothetical protein [Rufibacter sp. XAAS-G3-1]